LLRTIGDKSPYHFLSECSVVCSQTLVIGITYILSARCQSGTSSWRYIVGRTRLSPELYGTLQNVATPIFKAKDTILFQAGRPPTGRFWFVVGESE